MTKMHPVWLTFSNRRLESAFRAQFARRAFCADKAVLVFTTFMRILVTSRVYASGRQVAGLGRIVAYTVPVFVDIGLRIALESRNPELLEKWRNGVVAVSRFCILLFFGMWVPQMLMDLASSEEPIPFLTCFLWLTFCSGLQVHVALTFGMPLPFPIHIILQTFSVIFTVFLVKDNYCKLAKSMGMHEGSLIIMNTQEVLSKSGFWFGDAIAMHDFGNAQNLESFCEQLLIFYNVFWGGFVFSYMLWRIEWGKRVEFLKSIKQRDYQVFGSPDIEQEALNGNENVTSYVILPMAFPMFACTWNLIGYFVR